MDNPHTSNQQLTQNRMPFVTSPSTASQQEGKRKLSRACARCKNLKVRGEVKTETEPCIRCYKAGQECVTPGRKIRRTPPKREHLIAEIHSQKAEIEGLLRRLEELGGSSGSSQHIGNGLRTGDGRLTSTLAGQDYVGRRIRPPPPKREHLIAEIRAQASEIKSLLRKSEELEVGSESLQRKQSGLSEGDGGQDIGGDDMFSEAGQNDSAAESKAVEEWIARAYMSLHGFDVSIGTGVVGISESHLVQEDYEKSDDDEEYAKVQEYLDRDAGYEDL